MTLRKRFAILVALLLVSGTRANDKALTFRVTFDKAVSAKPFTGRVYVMMTKSDKSEPRFGPSWLKPEPMFARDVKDWKPGEELVIDRTALAFPDPLAKLPKAAYSIQAVMDFDRGDRNFSNAPGNGLQQGRSQGTRPRLHRSCGAGYRSGRSRAALQGDRSRQIG